MFSDPNFIFIQIWKLQIYTKFKQQTYKPARRSFMSYGLVSVEKFCFYFYSSWQASKIIPKYRVLFYIYFYLTNYYFFTWFKLILKQFLFLHRVWTSQHFDRGILNFYIILLKVNFERYLMSECFCLWGIFQVESGDNLLFSAILCHASAGYYFFNKLFDSISFDSIWFKIFWQPISFKVSVIYSV